MPDYAAVADTYRAAALGGLPPTRAVARQYGVAYSTAGTYVAQARKLGLLDAPPQPGSSPKRNRRALAVADALGVSYEALMAAVLEHAAGDLRV